MKKLLTTWENEQRVVRTECTVDYHINDTHNQLQMHWNNNNNNNMIK